MARTVLIVDDEEDLVFTLVRQVRRERPHLDVEGLSDPELALEAVRRRAPDVLVTDIRMPKVGGLQLISAARETSPGISIVVMTAFDTSSVRREVAKLGSLTYLQKPFQLDALLGAIDQAGNRTPGFLGAIRLPMVLDLVQMHALARVDGALRISGQDGNAVVWFQAGEIVHSVCGDRSGPEAFYDLLRWETGRFDLEPGARAPERTIDVSWQSLLLEGARRMDEAGRAARLAGGTDPAPPLSGSVAPGPLLAWRDTDELRASLAAAFPRAALVPVSEEASLAEAARELRPLIEPLLDDGGAGVLELFGGTSGIALFFGADGEALAFCADVTGREPLSRFRAAVSAVCRGEAGVPSASRSLAGGAR